MKKITLLVVILLAITNFVSAQNNPDFKQEIKVGGVVYTGWVFNMDNADFISRLDSVPNALAPFSYPSRNQFETSRNSFYFDRAYINIKAALTPQITARLTPDVYLVTAVNSVKTTTTGGNVTSVTTGTTTQYFIQMKYANFEYTPFTSDNGMSLSFSAGLIPNQWINNIEKYYGYRGIQKTFTDYSWTNYGSVNSTNKTASFSTGSFFSSSDLGMTTKFTFPKKYADLYVSLLNGNGFRNEGFDQNRFKDIMVTGFIYPLADQVAKKTDAMKKAKKTRLDGVADFTVGGFLYMGKLGNNEYPSYTGGFNNGQYKSTRFGGMLNFKYNFDKAGSIKVGGEYSKYTNQYPSTINPLSSSFTIDSTISGGGLSTWLEFNPPVESLNDKLFLTFRYDMFNPFASTSTPVATTDYFANNPKQSLMIIGLMFKPASVLTLGLSYQSLGFDQNYIVKYDGTPATSLNRFYVNAILDF